MSQGSENMFVKINKWFIYFISNKIKRHLYLIMQYIGFEFFISLACIVYTSTKSLNKESL